MASEAGSAARWHLRNRAEEPSFRAQAAAAVARLPEGPRPILDLGCGSGPLAGPVGEAGRRWIGLDRDGEMAAAAGSRFGRPAPVAVGDAAALPFPDGVFGAVLSLGLFEYLDRPAAALAEVRRVLVPGGTAVLLVPRRDAPWRRGLAAAAPLLRALGRRDPFDLRAGRRVTRAEARRWGRAAGLPLVEARPAAPALVPWPLERLLPRLDAALRARLPERFGTLWLLRYRRG